jgi:hypothetical protein
LIRTIVFPFMANDLYTGCHPVFVPSSSVVYCVASYVNLVGDRGEDALGLKTHSCRNSGSSGLMHIGRRRSNKNPLLLWWRRRRVWSYHSCSGPAGVNRTFILRMVVSHRGPSVFHIFWTPASTLLLFVVLHCRIARHNASFVRYQRAR